MICPKIESDQIFGLLKRRNDQPLDKAKPMDQNFNFGHTRQNPPKIQLPIQQKPAKQASSLTTTTTQLKKHHRIKKQNKLLLHPQKNSFSSQKTSNSPASGTKTATDELIFTRTHRGWMEIGGRGRRGLRWRSGLIVEEEWLACQGVDFSKLGEGNREAGAVHLRSRFRSPRSSAAHQRRPTACTKTMNQEKDSINSGEKAPVGAAGVG